MSEISVNHPRIKAVNEFHELAVHSAKNAILYAVKAGAELLALKDEVGHGNFMATCKRAFPFGVSTCERYMRVAIAVSNSSHVTNLTKAPETKLLAAIHQASQAANISGLYKDLGIIKDQRVAKRVEREVAAANRTQDMVKAEINAALFMAEDNLTKVVNNLDKLNDGDTDRLILIMAHGITAMLSMSKIEVVNSDGRTPLLQYAQGLVDRS